MADVSKMACPLCGATKIKLLWSGSGVGGQMMTVTGFATCEECLTVFRDVASSTAGFTLREAQRLMLELPERVAFMKQHREREAAVKTGAQGEQPS